MVKRLLTAVLGIALLAAVAGCSSTGGESGSSVKKGTIKITVGKS